MNEMNEYINHLKTVLGLKIPLQALTYEMVRKDEIAEDIINLKREEMGEETWLALSLEESFRHWDIAYLQAELICQEEEMEELKKDAKKV